MAPSDSAGPSARRPTTGRVRRGFGMASQTWGGGGGPPAYAIVRLNPDGTVEVLAGTQDLGTGSRTVFAQIAAEVLGARLADVRVVLGDTERLPYSENSWGSITMASRRARPCAWRPRTRGGAARGGVRDCSA